MVRDTVGSDRSGRSPHPLLPTIAQAGTVATIIYVAFAVLLLSGWASQRTVTVVTALVFPVLGLVYVPLAALAAASARGRLRAAWAALTIGLASWALGDVITSYFEIAVGQVPFPSWADAAYLSHVPWVIMALLLFPSARTWRYQSGVVLDGLIVTGSLFLISWLTVMRDAWPSDPASRVDFAIAVAYPAGDILIVTVGFLVLLRTPSGLRTPLCLLVAGLTCAAIADTVWVYRLSTVGYRTGGLPDVLFAAYPLLIIVALIAANRATPGPSAATGPQNLVLLWLPLVPLAIAALFVSAAPQDAVIEAPVAVTGVLLIVVTLARQVLAAAEAVRREHEIQDLLDRQAADLASAARYVGSILPGELTGPVEVSSSYLPARVLGGDSFGYTWIDDDHLIFYLIDVSGHGVEPALLSVSVHNLLRSGSLPAATLLAPDRVLAELNSRFDMDNHDAHYFTMWFGVYRLSTAILRYSSAGHPPALALTVTGGEVSVTRLGGISAPVGMFADSEFAVETYHVAPGTRILLYSDGVLGDPTRLADLVARYKESASAPESSLDSLISALPDSGADQDDDDRSLVQLTFLR